MHRTTVDITDEQRSSLVALAARRGERGFSRLVREAIDLYLQDLVGRERRTAALLELAGSLSGTSGARFERDALRARGEWGR